MGEWIAVEDRLPDGEGNVLLYVAGRGVIVGWMKYTKVWRPLWLEGEEVTHWQPLPPPPQPAGGSLRPVW